MTTDRLSLPAREFATGIEAVAARFDSRERSALSASPSAASPSAAREAEVPPPGPWRRFATSSRLMHYNRLAAVVVAANAGYAGYRLMHGGVPASGLAHLALANFALAVLIRQQYVINLLYGLASAAPVRWPLRVRWTLGKVYHYGGLHVGGAIGGSLWTLALVGVLAADGLAGGIASMAVSCALTAVLAGMLVTALPPLRTRRHDRFELTHRFGGWAALLLVWAQAALSHDTASLWLLGVLTLSIALPWLRLRKVPVRVERPSDHVAIVHFDYGVTPWVGSTSVISRSPLLEWHSFANLPPVGRTGFRVTVSRAGDWTARFIDHPPSHLWVKGIPVSGVSKIESLFKRVVYVATGSGIGPCLNNLLAAQVPARLVWVTRDPRTTYGDALVDSIFAVHPDALVWDSTRQGRPDLVRLAYTAWRDFDAEAVICVSNKPLTWKVVHGMESRGIPAYGAIWDS